MNINPAQYIPVLKVKRAEKGALGAISPSIKAYVVPLLEIVQRRRERPVDKHLITSFRDLAASLYGYPRCLLDLREIAGDGPSAAAEAFGRAETAGIEFTPVTGLSRTADVNLAVKMSGTRGVGVRLTRQELESGSLDARLNSFMSGNRLIPDDVDLILDLGPVEDFIPAGVNALAMAFLADVPVKSQWRSLTVTGCAFPFSMAVVNRKTAKRVKRVEWLAWRDRLYDQRTSLERLPAFGDCAIQHPSGVENFDPKFMQASATIRYTSGEDWLLVKGESTRKTLPSHQFPSLATRLVYGDLQGAFEGPQHCEGCRMAKASADGAEGLGSPEAWRKIGTIHHVTTVVQNDLASLRWP